MDDDGDLDLLVVNLDGESDSFFRNQGKFFVDDTVSRKLLSVPGVGKVKAIPQLSIGLGYSF